MPVSGVSVILQEYIDKAKHPQGCVVAQWIDTLPPEEQELLETLKRFNLEDQGKDKRRVSITQLFKELNSTGEGPLPFKATAFRVHFGDTCTCH